MYDEAKVKDFFEQLNFRPEDFSDPAYPGSYIYMNKNSVKILYELTLKFGKIVIHTGYGIKGAVVMDETGHSQYSYHYKKNGSSAIDWHFENIPKSKIERRKMSFAVISSGFTGVGIYFKKWRWDNKLLPFAFHTDLRDTPQIWTDNHPIYKIKRIYSLP